MGDGGRERGREGGRSGEREVVTIDIEGVQSDCIITSDKHKVSLVANLRMSKLTNEMEIKAIRRRREEG